MPKLIDYAGRFAFFEEACFALVRDHGPHHLSRHRLAHVLGTSISTVRRLLRAEADRLAPEEAVAILRSQLGGLTHGGSTASP